MKRLPVLLLLTLGVTVLLTRPATGQTALVVQLGPDQGMSLGVITPRPDTWSTDHSTAILPFGNYLGAQTGQPVYSRAYLAFPLNELPAGAVVQQATLELYVDDWPFDGSATLGVYQVTAAWDETMDWAGRAPLATPALATTSVSSTPGWYAWDVTTLVQGWANGAPNYGLALAAYPDPNATPDATGWAAAAQGRTGSDPTLAPRLTIVYVLAQTPTPTPPAPPPTQPPPTPTPSGPPPTQPPPTATPEAGPTPALLPISGGSPSPPSPLLWLAGGIVLALTAWLASRHRHHPSRNMHHASRQ